VLVAEPGIVVALGYLRSGHGLAELRSDQRAGDGCCRGRQLKCDLQVLRRRQDGGADLDFLVVVGKADAAGGSESLTDGDAGGGPVLGRGFVEFETWDGQSRSMSDCRAGGDLAAISNV